MLAAKSTNGTIEIQGLQKVYESKKSRFEALRDIDLTIGQNEFLTIVGPSGCGKVDAASNGGRSR